LSPAVKHFSERNCDDNKRNDKCLLSDSKAGARQEKGKNPGSDLVLAALLQMTGACICS
jgi:hypothetical protein